MADAGGWSVGLDVGGTKVLGVLLGPDGGVRRTLRVPTRHGVEGVVASAAEAVRGLVDAGGVVDADGVVDTGGRAEAAGLVGVGVGIPGLVEPDGGLVSHAVNLGVTGRDVPLAALLSAALEGVPVTVENDLNAAALGAAHVLGVGGDLAFLALGTGLAAGLVLDGRLRRGAVGAAGEIGHLPYRPEGTRCPCGQRGCLELYASGPAIEAVWPSRTGRPAPAEVFGAAAAGDPQATVVRDTFADAVAAAVRVLVLTCDVRTVVLGGGVAEIGAPLVEAVRAALERQARGSAFLQSLAIGERLRVVPAGHPVAPIGAARSVASARTLTSAAADVPVEVVT